jgi:hypothetical protein
MAAALFGTPLTLVLSSMDSLANAPGHRVYKYTTSGTSRRWDLRLKGNANLMKKVSEAFVNGAGFNG